MRSGTADPLDHVLRQAAAHKDVLIREWGRRLLLSHGDRVEQRAKKPGRRRSPAAK
jgi:hypothetical protein